MVANICWYAIMPTHENEWIEEEKRKKNNTKGRTDKYILKTSLLISVAEPRQIHE